MRISAEPAWDAARSSRVDAGTEGTVRIGLPILACLQSMKLKVDAQKTKTVACAC
jgi:hypothetical protein